MDNAKGNSDDVSAGKEMLPCKLEYGRKPRWGRATITVADERRSLIFIAGIAGVLTVAWWAGMILTCRPALDFFCICAFAPLILGIIWVTIGSQVATHARHYRNRRRTMVALTI